MFKKPFHVKTSTKLRSSDIRKLEFGFSGKTDVACTKVDAANDEILYIYSQDGVPSFIKFDSLDKKHLIVPTIQHVILHPDYEIPRVVLNEGGVIKFILNGADLFRPGVNMSESDSWTNGQIVGLALGREAPCFAVGITVGTPDDTGVAVKLLHVFGDCLWTHWPVDNVSLMTFFTPAAQPAAQPEKEVQHALSDESVDAQQVQQEQLTHGEMDELLETTLLQAIVKGILPGLSKSVQLPLNSSVLWKDYILAARQPNSPELNVKNSSYKKLSTFLTAMAKKGIITVKPAKSGDVLLTKIDDKHEAILNFVPWKIVQQSAPVKQKEQLLDIIELYRANQPSTMKIFTLLEPLQSILPDVKEGPIKELLFTAGQVKTLLYAFATKFDLINPNDKSEIWTHKQDDLHALYKGCTGLKRDEFLASFLEKMFQHHAIVIPGHDTFVSKGEWKPITLTVRRRGHAYLTEITKFQEYLPPNDTLEKVRSDLAKYCAAAVSLDDDGLHVQGTPIKELYAFFNQRLKIPVTQQTSRFINVVDKFNVTKKK